MAIDVICKMNVSENSPLKMAHNGKMYYFCSTHCQKTFNANPAKYVR